MAVQEDKVFKQIFEKFLIIYPDIEAIILTDQEGSIITIESRKEDFIKSLTGLASFLKSRLEWLQKDRLFQKYNIASMDGKKYRFLYVRLPIDIVLCFVSNLSAAVENIEPYALFLAEKVNEIYHAEKGDKVQVTMPSYQYESKIFEKYKAQMAMMGFDTGGIYRFKFVIIGDNAVGKTSCVRRFVENEFDKDYRSTLGLNIISHSFELLSNEIRAVIWDLGGQQHYHRFRRQYYLGSQAAFIVFDLTRRESFDNAKGYWYDELKEFSKKKDTPIVLVGNKSDLVKDRKVSYEEGVQLADYLSETDNSYISYIETSAKNGENIEEAFGRISYLFIIKCKEEEAKEYEQELLVQINSILQKKSTLKLGLFSESYAWSPALKILTGMADLGEFQIIKDEAYEKVYQYNNGLTLKNYTIEFGDVSDCDGVYCVFDAMGKEHIQSVWKGLLYKIIRALQPNKTILVGVRVKDDHNWSQILEEFNVDDELETKPVNLSFFKLSDEFQLDIYDQLKSMLNSL